MPRVPISEYRAKHILLGEAYTGVSVDNAVAVELSADQQYVVKVDQGIKKRMKQGLVRVGCDMKEVQEAIKEWQKQGHSQFLVEPLFEHDKTAEKYIMAERVRAGVRFVYTKEGGIEVESHPESLQEAIVINEEEVPKLATRWQVPVSLISTLYQRITDGTMAFVEINPCIISGESWVPLDAACLVDTCAPSSLWQTSDIPKRRDRNPEEEAVEELQKTTAASLKLKVMNRDGSIFSLLSGGGGSLTVLDAIAEAGKAKEIGNYGEYSGNPTQEETFLYARQILKLLLASRASKKVLLIAGGVANFTDIRSTFAGVVTALEEVKTELAQQKVTVVVRRGGPNEQEGLKNLERFLKEAGLTAKVMGSEVILTEATEAVLNAI